MPLTHVAQTVGFNIQTLRRILEDEGLYVRSRPIPLWTEAEVRVLRRDYGTPGLTAVSQPWARAMMVNRKSTRT